MSLAALRWVFECSKARGVDRMVLTVLAWHHNDDTGLCDPGVRTMAREAGCAAETVSRAVARLEATGELPGVDRAPGRVTRYTLNTQSTTARDSAARSQSTTARPSTARQRVATARPVRGSEPRRTARPSAARNVSNGERVIDGRVQRHVPGTGWIDTGAVLDTEPVP